MTKKAKRKGYGRSGRGQDWRKGASIVSGKRKQTILNALSVGVPLSEACHLAQIDESTLWRARKSRGKLRMAVKKAEAELIQGLTSIVLLAAKNGQWSAAAWLCERRWPQHFAKVERQEVSGPGGTPLAIATASQDEYVRAVRRALGFWDGDLGAAVSEAKTVKAQTADSSNGDRGSTALAPLPGPLDQ
jgi:hypothetical protein